ncbi:hypothetical protein KJ762_02795 [bacterium]|nr:hypothetical protein [bacterium]MBU1064543.1 hypothetical protein [bacterium]MBU1633419.1 hypothetical protein [bacterium]MBU1873349.1 hypothetical protein [bacterium]
MIFRFWFESIVGLFCIICMLLFGQAGAASFALFALLPVIMRIRKMTKPDERELQLFYKAGNLSIALVIITIYLISHFSGVAINGHAIGDNWMFLSITSILMFHGIAGLIVFRK